MNKGITHSKKAARAIGAVAAALIVLHIVTQYILLNWGLSGTAWDILQKFNVDEEVSIPTWFAQSLLLGAGLVAAWIAMQELRTGARWRRHWVGIAALLVYMSVDEGAALHELLIEPMQNYFGIQSGPLFFAWIIPVLLVVGILAIVYARFWWKLPTGIRTTFLIAAITFVVGAAGLEMISGDYWQANEFANNFTYRVLNAMEEGLEYAGVVIAFYGLLEYAQQYRLDNTK